MSAPPAPSRPIAEDVGIGAAKAGASFVQGADVLGTMNRMEKGDLKPGQTPNLLDAANPLKAMHTIAGDKTDWTGDTTPKPSETPDWTGMSPAQREEANQPQNYMQKVGQTAAIVGANVLPFAGDAIKGGAARVGDALTPREPTPEETVQQATDVASQKAAEQQANLDTFKKIFTEHAEQNKTLEAALRAGDTSRAGRPTTPLDTLATFNSRPNVLSTLNGHKLGTMAWVEEAATRMKDVSKKVSDVVAKTVRTPGKGGARMVAANSKTSTSPSSIERDAITAMSTDGELTKAPDFAHEVATAVTNILEKYPSKFDNKTLDDFRVGANTQSQKYWDAVNNAEGKGSPPPMSAAKAKAYSVLGKVFRARLVKNVPETADLIPQLQDLIAAKEYAQKIHMSGVGMSTERRAGIDIAAGSAAAAIPGIGPFAAIPAAFAADRAMTMALRQKYTRYRGHNTNSTTNAITPTNPIPPTLPEGAAPVNDHPGFDPKASGAAPETDITKNPQAGFVKNPFADYFNNAKGLNADQIQAKHPDIQLKRDVPAKDIHGNPVKIPEGEILTPYVLKGDKVMLKDGQTYTVSKNQYQNIKNNSVVEGEMPKEFAPELKGLEETVHMGTGTGERGGSTAKFQQYTLPGGKNYKEILVKAPQGKPELTIEPDGNNWIARNQFGKMVQQIPGSSAKTAQEALAYAQHEDSVPSRPDKGMAGEPTFTDPHWGEKNAITSLRLNEHTLPDGKTATFLEEEQSDWARAVRKEQKQVEGGFREPDMGGDHALSPTHPLLDQHTEIGIKRALQEAVNNGSDYFAWINGEQTSARYNLATHVESIKWQPQGPGHTLVSIEPKDSGSDIQVWVDTATGKISDKMHGHNQPDSWMGKPLDHVIGKGAADKVMAGIDKKGELSGEGLSFGGEWAKNLYDKQIPNIVKNLTGGKVETLDMGLPIGKNDTRFALEHGEGDLTPQNMKVDQVVMRIKGGQHVDYVITKVLGSGKFEAISEEKYHAIMDTKPSEHIFGMSPDEYAQSMVEKSAEPFDLTQKMSKGQQAIRLTPDIINRIKGLPQELKRPAK